MPTYGNAGGGQVTINYDALFSSTLTNYRSKLNDSISLRNVLWGKLKEKGAIESYDGGTRIEERLMYAINRPSVYKGYDVLDVDPIEGVTIAEWEPAEMATPIAISRREERINSGRAKVISMVDTKMKQADIGFREWWMTYFLQGNKCLNSGSTLITPITNSVNAAVGYDPIAKLIQKDPTVSSVVGNLNQATYPWWRNKALDFGGTAVNAVSFLAKMDSLYADCSDNNVGEPDLIMTDKITYQLWRQAYYDKYRNIDPQKNPNYPFEHFMFNRAAVVWDSRVPDVQNDALTAVTKGTAYFINTDFIKIRVDSATDFVMTPFITPANQTARVAQMLWMGAVTLPNRRVHGVCFNIARTLA